MPKFKVGDRVVREIDITKPNSKLRHGVIIERYSKPITHYHGWSLGPYPELYKVLWDSGEIESGFLPHGISFEMEEANGKA